MKSQGIPLIFFYVYKSSSCIGKENSIAYLYERQPPNKPMTDVNDVISTDLDTSITEKRRVVQTYVNQASHLVHLTIHNEVITTTLNHPFNVKNQGFVKASELQVGNEVINVAGGNYIVENISIEIVDKPETVYNFEVEEFHTYYVGESSILVHNKCEGGISTQGYSNFADGMSPEDAARYIANNEKAFFNEFSARAKDLSDEQIAEAFDAMKSSDYKKMVSYFDTSSPANGGVFWSGNKYGAAAYADSIGGTILEQTPGGQVFDNWRGLQGMYPEWNTGSALDQRPIWEALSSQYANSVDGSVTYAHSSGYVGNIWEKIEFPIIKNRIKQGFVNGISEVLIDGK